MSKASMIINTCVASAFVATSLTGCDDNNNNTSSSSVVPGAGITIGVGGAFAEGGGGGGGGNVANQGGQIAIDDSAAINLSTGKAGKIDPPIGKDGN